MIMKKLLLTTCAMILGTILAYSQGTINTLNQSAIISTNNGANIGPIAGGNGSYLFEVLDMQQSTWTGLSGLQQAEAYDLIDNPSAVALWTDSGVPAQHQSVHVGGISGAPVTALNWPSPGSSSGYGGAGQTPDYYTIVGWSANEGAGWATVAAELNGSTAWTVSGPGSWFGQTAVAFNYAGGGTAAVPPPSVELWGISTTGLAGSGGVMSMTLSPIPEPSTMVLAGLGGLSLLLFRRRH
jgi:hypothetical protein